MERYGTAVHLGSGSSGEIFRSYDSRLGHHVALKFLQRDNPTLIRRMLREAEAQAQIDHPGICKIYETGRLDDRPFISMELIEGEELGTAAAKLPVNERVALMVQVAEAVQAAHGHGMIHRDLKPENILVEKKGDVLRPVVVDFGLVMDLNSPSHRITRNGEPVGTPAFMAPEQAAGRREDIDERTDVYGLGSTLYFILTGRPPFDGKSTTELLIQALEAKPARPTSLIRDLPPALEPILLKCLEKDPDDRYPSAEALAEDLRRFLQGLPCEAGPQQRRLSWQRFFRRHRRATAVGLATLTVLCMGLWTAEQQARETSKRLAYEQRYVQISNDLDWMLRAAQMSSRHDISPSRERVRRRISELETELGDLNKDGSGPAHYAIGRAYAALQEDEKARRHLEQAWELGFQAPEVGYFLGLVIGRQYEDALERVRHVHESEVRRIYLDDARRRYREPAKRYLEQGREAEAASVEYVEALIDFYEERYEPALAKLSLVKQRLPWLYEADLAEGKVYRRMADEQFAESRIEDALNLYGKAEEALRRAMDSAASDPLIYPELCRLLSIKLEAELDWSIPPTEEELEEQLLVCDQSLEVAPRSLHGLRYASLGHELTARFWADRSWDPERSKKAVLRAEELAKEAVRLSPEDPDSHRILAQALMTHGRLKGLFGESGSLEDYLHAEAGLEKAMQITQGPQGPLRMLSAYNHQLIASSMGRHWQSPAEPLNKALAMIQDELMNAPSSFTLHCEAGNVQLQLAIGLSRLGEPYAEHLEAAEASLQLCSELNPKYHWAYIGLAHAVSLRTNAECPSRIDAISGYAEARALVHTVEEMDPGFESGRLDRASYWSSEALCRLAHGKSPAKALAEVDKLVAQAEAKGQPSAPFYATLKNTLEIRDILLQDPERGTLPSGRLLEILEASDLFQISPASLKQTSESDKDWTISQRLYRVDRLLWLAEASWELGPPPNARLLDEAQRHIDALAEIRDGELTRLPQYQSLAAIVEWQRIRNNGFPNGAAGAQGLGSEARSRRSEIQAMKTCAVRLRQAQKRLPVLALHLEPWLRRIEILEKRAWDQDLRGQTS